MEIRSEDVQQISGQLQDDEARFLFEKRLLYSLTKDASYIRDIALSFPECQELREKASERADNFIFGAGTYGDVVSHLIPNHWLGILDNDRTRWGKKIGNVTIVPPETICEHPESHVFLAVRTSGKRYQDEILQQLLDLGVNESRIVRVDKVADQFFERRTQYFDLPELPHVKDEVFVDAGAFDGATSKDFADWAGDYQHIYAFEADPVSQPLCQSGLQKISTEKTTLIPCGVWNECTELRLNSIGPQRGQIDSAGTVRIRVTSIDHELVGKRVTFIKMDIEGAEMEALHGAEQIIREQRPKLAICLYHQYKDVIEIPKYLLSLIPGYRLYLRHYTFWDSETVLYAI